MKGQSAAKHILDKIGKTFNNIKIISIHDRIKGRLFYNVECLNCGKESIMRSDRFTGTQKLKTCSHCRQDEAIKTSISRATPLSVYSSLYSSYKSNAINRGFKFSLTKEEFTKIVSNNCYYCNSEPIESPTSKGFNRTNIPVKHNGVDRKDNNIGYTKKNSVPCCTTCNMMKKTLGVSEFINHVFKISEHMKVQRLVHCARTSQANGDGKGENPEKD